MGGGVTSHASFVGGSWTAGLGTWATIFWTLRRRTGPVTFVERQIAHVWASSMVSIVVLFYIETILGLPVLTLSPVLGLVGGMVFVVKAGTLSGQFYFQAAALFATALGMAALQRMNIPLGLTLFGVVSAGCFFLPGLKYYRRRELGPVLDHRNSWPPRPRRESQYDRTAARVQSAGETRCGRANPRPSSRRRAGNVTRRHSRSWWPYLSHRANQDPVRRASGDGTSRGTIRRCCHACRAGAKRWPDNYRPWRHVLTRAPARRRCTVDH